MMNRIIVFSTLMVMMMCREFMLSTGEYDTVHLMSSLIFQLPEN